MEVLVEKNILEENFHPVHTAWSTVDNGVIIVFNTVCRENFFFLFYFIHLSRPQLSSSWWEFCGLTARQFHRPPHQTLIQTGQQRSGCRKRTWRQKRRQEPGWRLVSVNDGRPSDAGQLAPARL